MSASGPTLSRVGLDSLGRDRASSHWLLTMDGEKVLVKTRLFD